MGFFNNLLSTLFLVSLVAPIRATKKSVGCPCVPTSRQGGSCYHFTNAPKDLYWLPPSYTGVCHFLKCQPKYICKPGSRLWCTKKPLTRVVVPISNKGPTCRIQFAKRYQLVPYTPTRPVKDPRFRKPPVFHLYFAGDTSCWILYSGKRIAKCRNYRRLTVVRDIPITKNCDPVHIKLLDRRGLARGFIAAVDAGGHMIASGGKHVRFSRKLVKGWTSPRFSPSKWNIGTQADELTQLHADLRAMTGATGVTWKVRRRNQRVFIVISLKKFCRAPYWL